MSPDQPWWASRLSTLRLSTFAPRRSNSPLIRAISPSSVVQTGVKSLGCENSTPQLSPSHSWKDSGPSVVSAVKSGASSPSRRTGLVVVVVMVVPSSSVADICRCRERSRGARFLSGSSAVEHLPSGQEEAMQFGILGPLEVLHDGRRLQLGGVRRRAVLARLLLDPGTRRSAPIG